MTAQPAIGASNLDKTDFDPSKQEGFIGKVLGDASATLTTVLASLGDRLGLFKDLAAHRASTSAELANRTGIQERYAREWLGGMSAAGYIDYDPATRRVSSAVFVRLPKREPVRQ